VVVLLLDLHMSNEDARRSAASRPARKSFGWVFCAESEPALPGAPGQESAAGCQGVLTKNVTAGPPGAGGLES